MTTISIDIETYSDVDLAKCGVYRYAESPAFEILLFGYSVDGGAVQVVDLACGEEIPGEVLDALTDDCVIKWAFNASFERVCLSRYLRERGRRLEPLLDGHSFVAGAYGSMPSQDGVPDKQLLSAGSSDHAQFLSPIGWRCSMVWAATLGLPLSLKGVGAVLNLSAQKMDEGKALIRYFSMPCAATKAGGRTRNRPADDPARWQAFKAYNQRDVEVEMAIQERLQRFPVPDAVWEEYHLDQEINDRGVAIDRALVAAAIEMDERSRTELTERLQRLTGLTNPNSVQQMKSWLSTHGLEVDSLGKRAVTEMLRTAPPDIAEVLSLRQQLARSSVRKYQTMQRVVCADGRARGMFQFYGANRTGRWAGRLIQLQNLPQNHLSDLDAARALVRSGDHAAVQLLYEDVPDTLSQLIRTAFIPREGCRFYVADFSAIEARVIAWMAGEAWRQEVFARGGDIYCASASQMFKVPVEKHGVNGHLRQKGKIAELALGYGGSVGALRSMGALEMGLSEEELPTLVDAWRQANPRIVALWWDVDHAVLEAVKFHHTTQSHGLTFSYRSGMLLITLPSGRSLAYVRPRVGMNQFSGACITYEGIGPTKRWEHLESYGPKFVENIVQATARDILCYAMRALGHYSIVMHIHDELVIEAAPCVSLAAICEQMGRTPPWAKGLLLRADGYVTDYYRKD